MPLAGFGQWRFTTLSRPSFALSSDHTAHPVLPLTANDAIAAATAAVAKGARRKNLVVALSCSIALHGAALPLFLLANAPKNVAFAIPIDIVELADETAGPPQPDTAPVPVQQAGKPSTPAAEPAGASRSNARPDDLEAKLNALAKLRQSSLDTRRAENTLGLSHTAAMRDDMPGPSATLAVRDFIRAQVERRWTPDLAALGRRNFSVLIYVEITGAGVVRRAEIADPARSNSDGVYRAIALSARNAVLLSSPFALPAGRYSELMDFTLRLDTEEARR